MPKKICFIHTETTGLHEFQNEKVYKKNLFGYARMVSFSWIIAGNSNEVLKKQKFIIKPRCMNIPDDCVQFHGISQEIALKKGTDIEEVLKLFIADLSDVSIISSHGLEFHLKTVQAELVRYNRAVDFNKFLLIDTNTFPHGVTPGTLANLSKKILNKKLDDTIMIICELFFKLYDTYESEIKQNNKSDIKQNYEI